MRAVRPAFALWFLALAAAPLVSAAASRLPIVGRVQLAAGAIPPSQRDVKGDDRAVCGATVADERILVGPARGLANVVLMLQDGPDGDGEVPDRVAVLDIRGCLMRPRIQTVVVGQTLEVRNSDPLSYAIEASLDGEETLFRVPLTIQNQSIPFRMKRPGVLSLRSGRRDWVEAFVIVTSHPFATVTAPDGSYRIDDVPAGVHTVVAWHETLGSKRLSVDVKNGLSRADFVFSGP